MKRIIKKIKRAETTVTWLSNFNKEDNNSESQNSVYKNENKTCNYDVFR